METTAVTQLPAVTDVTDVTNGIEVFFYDVVQYNGNAATFFDSCAKYVNNIIHALKSTQKYFVWIHDIADTIYNSGQLPAVFGSAIAVTITLMLIDFFRGR